MRKLLRNSKQKPSAGGRRASSLRLRWDRCGHGALLGRRLDWLAQQEGRNFERVDLSFRLGVLRCLGAPVIPTWPRFSSGEHFQPRQRREHGFDHLRKDDRFLRVPPNWSIDDRRRLCAGRRCRDIPTHAEQQRFVTVPIPIAGPEFVLMPNVIACGIRSPTPSADHARDPHKAPSPIGTAHNPVPPE